MINKITRLSHVVIFSLILLFPSDFCHTSQPLHLIHSNKLIKHNLPSPEIDHHILQEWRDDTDRNVEQINYILKHTHN